MPRVHFLLLVTEPRTEWVVPLDRTESGGQSSFIIVRRYDEWMMNDEWLRHEKKKRRLDTGRSVGRLVHILIFSMDSRNRSGVGRWQGRLRSCPVVSHVMFFSKIGGISSKYSFFYRFYAANMFVWMDGRMDGRFVGWWHVLLTLTTWPSLPSLLIAIHTYLSHPPRHPPNRPRRQSSMIILSNPHKQRRLEEVMRVDFHVPSRFNPCCIANVFITSFSL